MNYLFNYISVKILFNYKNYYIFTVGNTFNISLIFVEW